MNTRSVSKTAIALSTALLAGVLFSAVAPAHAYGEGDMVNTLRTPIIYGAPNGPSWTPAQEGCPPPIGSGDCPMPVTGGDYGAPCPPPSHVSMPLFGPLDKDQVNAYTAPYLTPPPSTNGYDQGSINGSNGGYGLQAPASVVNVCPDGGMVGVAPTRRWEAQRAFDHGRPANVRPASSALNDYGQKLSEKPDLKMCPQFSQDGPRPRGTAIGQTTQDLHGNRTLFKGPNLRSQLTIAPY